MLIMYYVRVNLLFIFGRSTNLLYIQPYWVRGFMRVFALVLFVFAFGNY